MLTTALLTHTISFNNLTVGNVISHTQSCSSTEALLLQA